MSIADGSQHRLSYIFESTYGTTPSTPTFEPFRHTGTDLGVEKTELKSQEISSDRQYGFVRHGNKSVGNNVNFELAYGAQDDWLEAALGGTWSTKIDSGAISADSAAGTFTRASGSFITDGFVANTVVTSSGYASSENNGRFLITNVAALVLTVTALEGQTQGTEAGGGDEQFIVDATLENGTTRRYATFERYFADQGTYVFMTGLNASSLQLSIAPDSVVSGTLALVGKDIEPATASPKASSTYPTATTTEPYDSFTGVIRDGGATIAVIQSIDFTCDNSMDRRFVVFDDTSLLPGTGRFMLSGTVSAYFDSITLYNKFISETASNLQFELTDPDGNTYWFYMPNIKYNSGNPDVSDDGSVTLSMSFTGVKDSVIGKTLVIQRVPA
jgi:hypothetical protein